MTSPVSLSDLGNFLQNIIGAFEHYLFFVFTLMVAFYVAVGVRRLLVGYKQ